MEVPKGSMYCKDMAAIAEVTKPLHITSDSLLKENVSNSSRPKRTPPMGEPNATDTPAEAAAARSFRFWTEGSHQV